MKLFSKIRLKVARNLLDKRYKRLKRNKGVFNLDNAKKIGVIFSTNYETDWIENKPFIDFLNEKKLKLTVLVFLKNKNLSTYYTRLQNVNFFSSENLNLFFIPKSDFINEFLMQEFDLLINLGLENPFPITYISALSKASFKVGLKDDKNLFNDLMIDLGNLKNKEVYFDQLKHYLSIINNN